MNKIGRNDPCPCGSLKKYKKCCLPRQEMANEEAKRIADVEWEQWYKNDLAQGEQNLADLKATGSP